MMQSKLWNKFFAFCLILQSLYMLSFNMVTPLIAHYVVDLGGSTFEAGVVAGMFSLLAFLFRPLVGYSSDRMNRKALMVFGFALCVISMAGYGISSTVLMVAVFRVLHALALCIQTTLITVIAIDFIPHDRIAEGVGYVGIAAMLGMSFGPGLGVLISDAISTQGAFFSGAAAMLAALVFVFPLKVSLPLKKWGEGKLRVTDLFNVSALPLSVYAMSFAFCAGLTSSFMVLLGSIRGIEGIAAFFFVSSMGMIFVRPIAGRYTDRHGLRRVGFVGFLSEVLAMTSIAFAQSLPLVLAAAAFRTFGQGMAQSAIQGQVLKDAGDSNRGVASSTFYLGVDVGQGLGAIVGGMIADHWGYSAAFLSGPCMLCVGLLSFAVWGRRRRARRMREGEEAKGIDD